MQTIKAIFIDPDTATTSIVNLDTKDNDIDLDVCYKLLDCDLVEFVYFGQREILILDEEGLLKQKKVFQLKGVGQQYFCGKALIVKEEGENCTSLDEDRIEIIRKLISYPEAQEDN